MSRAGRQFIKPAIRQCVADWGRILTYPSKANFWKKCSDPQLGDALAQKPMCLSKIGIAITAVDIFASRSKIENKIDIYKHIDIAIAAFRIEGFTKDYFTKISASHQIEIENCKRELIPFVKLGYTTALLQDVAGKKINLSYNVAEIICKHLSVDKAALTPVLARRINKSGMRPASEHLAFVPRPLPGQ